MRLLSNNPEVVRCEFGWSQVSELPPDGSPPAVSPQFRLAIERLTTTTFFFFHSLLLHIKGIFLSNQTGVPPLIVNITLSLFSFFSKAHFALLFYFGAFSYCLVPFFAFRRWDRDA
jgi:hypothetical protein